MYNLVTSIGHVNRFSKPETDYRIKVIGTKPKDPYGWNNDLIVQLPNGTITILTTVKSRFS